MSEPDPHSRKLFEDLMRKAGAHKRAVSARLIANEQRFRDELKSLEHQRTAEERADRVKRDLRRHAEEMHVKSLITSELAGLEAKREGAIEGEERAGLEAEIAHLHVLRANLRSGLPRKWRKPRDGGIATPAVQPRGPVPGQGPKQGGAEAPLDQ